MGQHHATPNRYGALMGAEGAQSYCDVLQYSERFASGGVL